MDELKDIQRTDSLSRFLDTHAVRTNAFGENSAADRVYRRAERIVAGLYILTNHIPEEESVRGTIRSVGSEILRDALRLRDEMRSPHSRSVVDLQGRIRYLISLMRILVVSGYISQQNATVVIEALDELGTFLTASQRSILSENVALSRDDLVDVRVPSYRSTSGKILKDMSNVTDIKDTQILKDIPAQSKSNGTSIGNANVRVQSILEILRIGGTLGIKDICANLPEYSEKMIQRELLELAKTGKIKKTGLKRWSRYSIVA